MAKKPEINLEDILTDKAGDDALLEIPVGANAINLIFYAVAVTSFVAIGYLAAFAVMKNDYYKEKSGANMSGVEIEKGERGIIFDRFGKPFVLNTPILNLILAPRSLPENQNLRENFLNRIKGILRLEEEAWSKITASLKNKSVNRVLLGRNMDLEKIVALQNLANAERIDAIRVEKDFERLYEEPEVFAHILGYVGLGNADELKNNKELLPDDTIGKNGLEYFYDELLRGQNGIKIKIRNAFGEIQDERLLEESRRGFELKSSIDAELQKYFFEALKKHLVFLGRSRAAGIALDPLSGEILSLVSLPSYDPRDTAAFLYDENQALWNRTIAGLYNPGSMIKPLVAAAALYEKVIRPEDEILSLGWIDVPNPYDPKKPSRFLDWRPQGLVNLKSAIAKSSNVYFYEIGGGFEKQIGLGIERLKKYWGIFGLGDKTGIDLPGEKTGILPDPAYKEKKFKDDWRLGDTYNVSIGQGDLAVTPIELINYISAIGNKGKLLKPRVILQAADQNGNVILENSAAILRDLTYLEPELEKVRQGMEDAVSKPYGTAFALNDLPFKVAAKTGTAQTKRNTETNAFFVGFAPAENPKITILILIEDSLEGSHNTLPVAKDILMWYYKNRIK